MGKRNFAIAKPAEAEPAEAEPAEAEPAVVLTPSPAPGAIGSEDPLGVRCLYVTREGEPKPPYKTRSAAVDALRGVLVRRGRSAVDALSLVVSAIWHADVLSAAASLSENRGAGAKEHRIVLADGRVLLRCAALGIEPDVIRLESGRLVAARKAVMEQAAGVLAADPFRRSKA